ncbi:hypothetical protein [Streptomyces sp.]|uniref:hypothetical protein n=1 Tax=Streptomyces sp. TaxID=1931 RepID=UPI002F421B9B
MAKVYRDPRQTPESRELILLLAWLAARDPDRNPQVGKPRSVWARANDILGVDFTRRQPPRLAHLVASDAPRYEMDWHSPANQGRACQAPMIRRAGECGQNSVDSFARTDPDTGWLTLVWTCSRHRAWGSAQHRIERAKPRVEPIPNAGGLLPCYFRRTDETWVELYRWARAWKHDRSWEPPSYGLRADRWPRPGKEPAVLAEGEPPRLHLAAAGGELLAAPDVEGPK